MRVQPNLPGMRGFLGHTHAPLALRDGDAIVVTIPALKLTSLNPGFRGTTIGARMAQAHKAKRQRDAVAEGLAAFPCPPEPPLVITLTRMAPGELDSHDNLPGSFKHCVDAVAKWLGLKDNDKRLTWRYAQSKGRRGEYAVTIRIERTEEVAA